MKATACTFSHVGVILDGMVYHAVGTGVEKMPIEMFIAEGHGFEHRFEIDCHNAVGGRYWLEGNLDRDYSESQLVGFAVNAIAWMLPTKVLEWILEKLGDGQREMICSELVIRFAVLFCNLVLPNDINPDFVTPEECAAIMQKVRKLDV